VGVRLLVAVGTVKPHSFQPLNQILFEILRDTMKKLILALVLFGIALNANADLSGPAVIVDGDTLSIAGNKVRLHGIDTPEKNQTCRGTFIHQ